MNEQIDLGNHYPVWICEGPEQHAPSVECQWCHEVCHEDEEEWPCPAAEALGMEEDPEGDIQLDQVNIDSPATYRELTDPEGATDRQVAYIVDLAEKVHLPQDTQQRLQDALPTMDRETASKTIDWLKQCLTRWNLWLAETNRQKAGQGKPDYCPDPIRVTGPGYFRHEGTIYKVLPSRANPERLYAKELVVEGCWVMARGMVYRLTEEDRMPTEAIAEYGRVTGHCLLCGRLLTDPESIDRGVGPVCAKREGLL